MSIMTTDLASLGDENSFTDGYTDGELAAITQLSSRRAHARAAMAEQYDPLYAQGYIDGYLHQIQVTAALNEQNAR